jgi:transposase-like protein
MDKQKTSQRFPAEVRARAVRMVSEHRADHASRWAAIVSISANIGCTAEALRRRVHEAERDQRLRP